ncbi:MAG: single-stranded-DNA-specific exonuclease RecJ, partial [Flavobacteriaceae bacterium]|nr:single-stranded-DNA-specific exonuclease RecJ [Flavobacteriaceae bacterium]
APEKYDDFKNAFESYVSTTLDSALKIPQINIDSPLSFSEISPKFIRILKQMAPFGPENPIPVFKATGVYDTGYAKVIGADQTHLKGTLTQDGTTKINFVAFKKADALALLSHQKKVDIVFNISENFWQGQTTIQLQLLDIKPHEG